MSASPCASNAGRRRAFALTGAAYATAVAAAAVSIIWGTAPAAQHPIMQAAIADGVATLVIFGFSFGFRNSSLYDPYWSVAPPCLGLMWWWLLGDVADPRAWLVMGVVLCWAVRLTCNWARGWQGLAHEDWRYAALKARLGALYWPVSLLGIHLFPTVLVFLGCLPLYFVLSAPAAALNGLDAAALLVAVAAIWLEARADRELARFRANRESPRALLDSGVWAWCRHPNYLGEIGLWLALALFGWAAGAVSAWNFAGFAAMILLFELVSIPMIEAKLVAAKPGYAAYRRRTFRLLPLPGRKT